MFGLFKKRKKRSRKTPGRCGIRETSVSPRDVGYVILDTELTGLNRKRDSIISVGALKMVGGRIEMGQTFYELVKPRSEMKRETVVIHEITPSEVLEKPAIDQIITRFHDFCSDSVLVGHYISMDLFFINRELKRVLGVTLGNPVLDTMALADWLRWNTPNLGEDGFSPKNYQLHEVAKELGIPVQGAHNALRDAFMSAQVFQRLLPRLDRYGVKNLGELLKVGNPYRRIGEPGVVI